MTEILRVELRDDRDVVLARQRARQVAALLGFEPQDQARIATAVSEVSRNAVLYGGSGRVEFHAEITDAHEFVVRVADHGPGIADLQAVLAGQAGSGNGLVVARRIVDRFEIETSGAGTTVVLAKSLPRKALPLNASRIRQIHQELASEPPQSVHEEFSAQNQELLHVWDELRKEQAKLAQVSAELEETNRGVVALYADLEEKAESLQRLNQQKNRFYSSMSHEFRTPINSILSIARILLDHLDGDLTPEQTKQVTLIEKSAKNLLEWITDLLDIAKVEAGKLEVKPTEFVVADLLTSLRGVMRPLLVNPAVELIVENPADELVAFTDEGKLAQILRNFVSNAIKFTEAGEIRVRASASPDGERLRILVSDTGIGIAPEYHQQIFEEFTQVENPLQRRARGTGLGLSLSKRLAELLRGGVDVASQPGRGSTFSVDLPRIFLAFPASTIGPPAAARREAQSPAAGESLVLVIDDDEASRYVVRQALAHWGIAVAEAADGGEGLAMAAALRPRAIVLDLAMPDMDGFRVLEILRADQRTENIPVILRTSKPIELVDRSRLREAIDVTSKHPETGPAELQRALAPSDFSWKSRRPRSIMPEPKTEKILVVDDDEAKRYSLVRILRAEGFDVSEAADGETALVLAVNIPDLILLDVKLPDISGLEVCRRLKANPATGRIPVMHVSGTFVTPEHRVRGLDSGADAYLSDNASAGEVLATARALLRARRAEQIAIESQQQYRTLVEVLPQLVWSSQPDGHCDYLSPSWVEFTGVPAQEHMGDGWLDALHPEDRSNVGQNWADALAGRSPYDVEYRLRRHDGEYRWFHALGVPLLDEDGHVTKWFGTCTDVHLQREAAAERAELLVREKAAREEAEQANRLKDEFLATLSHELRTPLMAILGWAELLQTGALPADEAQEGIRTIHRNARAQSQLINDLLDVSRIISGKMRLDVQSIDVHGVIQAAVESIRTAADAKEIRLIQVLDPATGNISGDAGRLQQVIWNLLSNAIKFTPKQGRVAVQLARVDSHVEINVADSGQGIDPEFLPHVFERFRQQDASSRRSQGGLGLGLAIVRNLVELHGGTIVAHSAGLGKGARFTVRLPVTAVVHDSPFDDSPRILAQTTDFEPLGQTQNLSGVNILLVDDEQDARDILAKTLEQRHARVVKAATVDEAVARFGECEPDILVSDIGMPGQDGFDLIRKIRAAEMPGRRIPAIALTAFARAEDRRRALLAGFQSHVSKPVIPSELVAIVANLVSKPR